MEVWALEGFEVLGATIIGGRVSNPKDALESFRLLVRELRSLALELNHFLVFEKNFQINRKEAKKILNFRF
ncbi:hypothetical protein MUK42_01381 [Musa troglodytarum]|uniref:DNA-directed RNA polymerase n=1 Tax=Musa troglodytarum TaxID=320322 RepID=A0A9E7FGE2_9LILI|nr:hypothetical protein MUK42_01381 [Musa troglodytarum]